MFCANFIKHFPTRKLVHNNLESLQDLYTFQITPLLRVYPTSKTGYSQHKKSLIFSSFTVCYFSHSLNNSPPPAPISHPSSTYTPPHPETSLLPQASPNVSDHSPLISEDSPEIADYEALRPTSDTSRMESLLFDTNAHKYKTRRHQYLQNADTAVLCPDNFFKTTCSF